MAFHFYYFRVHTWVDIVGNELTLFDWKTKMDVVQYRQVCTSAEARQETAKLRSNIQIDFNECLFGILGITVGDAIDCEWQEYYLDTPIFDEGLYNLDKQWTFWEERCLNSTEVSIFEYDPEELQNTNMF